MHPILFQLGPLTIHTYGALLALGAGLGIVLLVRLAGSAGLDQERVLALATWVLVMAVAGSRLFYVLIEPAQFLRRPWEVFYLWQGGLVFYGGLLGGLATAWWLARRWGLRLLPLMDSFAPALALGQAIGRLGCFSAGCCYGLPWPGGWAAVTFSDPLSLASPLGLELHPTQIYTAASLAAICGLLLWRWPRRRFAGQVFCTYGLLHGLARVIIEQFRGDWRGEALLGFLTPTALAALGLALASALGLVLLRKQPQAPAPEQAP